MRARYNGEYVFLCQNKQTKCPYADFVERVKQIETNYEQQCNISNGIVAQWSFETIIHTFIQHKQLNMQIIVLLHLIVDLWFLRVQSFLFTNDPKDLNEQLYDIDIQ